MLSKLLLLSCHFLSLVFYMFKYSDGLPCVPYWHILVDCYNKITVKSPTIWAFYILISFSTSIMQKQAMVPHVLYIVERLQSPHDVQLWPISNLTMSHQSSSPHWPQWIRANASIYCWQLRSATEVQKSHQNIRSKVIQNQTSAAQVRNWI